jgi:hypothetical protein
MKKHIGIVALSLALAFGFSMVAVNTASAIGSPNPEELLQEQAVNAETPALFELGERETKEQYRALDPVETEFNFEEVIESVGAAGV